MVPSLSAHLPYLWLVAASLIAGAMNALAGGGSFLSFPALLAIGVPPIQANATNTVALWPGQITSVWALRHDLRRDLLVVVAAASALGGTAAKPASSPLISRLIGAIFGLGTVVGFFNCVGLAPKTWTAAALSNLSSRARISSSRRVGPLGLRR